MYGMRLPTISNLVLINSISEEIPSHARAYDTLQVTAVFMKKAYDANFVQERQSGHT